MVGIKSQGPESEKISKKIWISPIVSNNFLSDLSRLKLLFDFQLEFFVYSISKLLPTPFLLFEKQGLVHFIFSNSKIPIQVFLRNLFYFPKFYIS